MPNSFIENVNILATKIVPIADDILVSAQTIQDSVLALEAISNDVEAKHRDILIIETKVDAVDSKIDGFDSTYYAKKLNIENIFDAIKVNESALLSDLSEGNATLASGIVSINQSISAANVIKHDLDAGTLASADVNAYLMSTIGRADNAQNALDLKVQQNLLALDDIANDNIITIEAKAQSAGNMIDLKIAMAVEARNSLSTIENSVLIAAASADKAALAYEQVSDLKALVDGVIDEATYKATALNEAIHQGNLITLDIGSKSVIATQSAGILNSAISSAAAPTAALNNAISQWNVLDLNTLNDVARAEYNRLVQVIPVAQNLSAETSAAVSASQNISAATNIGNVLLNALEATNTQANGYISSLDSIISNTVDAKVEAVIGTVADAKIAEITAVAIANQEAIDGINDADISMLEI
jgi:hypothetical protein